MHPPNPDFPLPVLSVGEFVATVNSAFATAVFPGGAWIEGEVAEYRVSQDKWVWFLLKDRDAVVSCFATAWQLRTPLEDGMQIRAFGMPKVHPKSGKFSVVVDRVTPVGEGALRRAFELLKKQLAEEGLFAAERKRPIPVFPEKIGLIASTESAAYTDFLRILKSRWGGIEVNAMHVQVQGRDAVPSIVAAFQHFNAHPELADVLVLTRGGGSLEDLQAFNSEEVVRAVFGSAIPVVVGVGHERDETLADYAADLRASTPTNAAELVVPDRRDVLAMVSARASSMSMRVTGRVAAMASRAAMAVSQLEMHMRRREAALTHRLHDFERGAALFFSCIGERRALVEAAALRIAEAASRRVAEKAAAVAGHERMLVSLDPRRLLRRGYALVWRGGRIVKSSAQVDIGKTVTVQLGEGTLDATVASKDGQPGQHPLL